MTIAIIALSASAMARIANRCLTLVAQGTTAHRELQQRWIVATSKLCVLGRAKELFSQQDSDWLNRGATYPLPNRLDFTVDLGDQPLRFVLNDEQARANVNEIGNNHEHELFATIAQNAASNSIPIRLQPLPGSAAPDGRKFVSWGQIIDFPKLRADKAVHEVIATFSETFTCWGNGKINIMRSGDDALRLAVKNILTDVQIQELLVLRRGQYSSIDQLWQAMNLHRQTQMRLAQVVGEESSSFSLLIIRPRLPGDNMTLLVQDTAKRSRTSVKMFRW